MRISLGVLQDQRLERDKEERYAGTLNYMQNVQQQISNMNMVSNEYPGETETDHAEVKHAYESRSAVNSGPAAPSLNINSELEPSAKLKEKEMLAQKIQELEQQLIARTNDVLEKTDMIKKFQEFREDLQLKQSNSQRYKSGQGLRPLDSY